LTSQIADEIGDVVKIIAPGKAGVSREQYEPLGIFDDKATPRRGGIGTA
jgi:hypothetical protein